MSCVDLRFLAIGLGLPLAQTPYALSALVSGSASGLTEYCTERNSGEDAPFERPERTRRTVTRSPQTKRSLMTPSELHARRPSTPVRTPSAARVRTDERTAPRRRRPPTLASPSASAWPHRAADPSRPAQRRTAAVGRMGPTWRRRRPAATARAALPPLRAAGLMLRRGSRACP